MRINDNNKKRIGTVANRQARLTEVARLSTKSGDSKFWRVRLPELLLFAFLVGVVGCTGGNESSVDGGADINNAAFLLPEDPVGAQDVIAVRDAAEDGDDVLVVGRVGGGENPWIEGRAAFSIVDSSLQACSDIPGDNCPKPWDYCCETDKLSSATALVTVVGDDGVLVRKDARDLLNIKELSTVVVKGKAKRDEQGNLTIKATGVFVREL